MPKRTTERRPTRTACLAPLLVLLGSLLATGCGEPAGDRIHRSQFFALGTLVDISLYDVDEALATRAVTTAEQVFRRMHREAHAWNPGPLADLNAGLARGARVTPPDSLLQLIRQAKQLAADSSQLFNPGIGRLVALWGFHRDEPRVDSVPAPDEIRRLTEPPITLDDLEISAAGVRSRDPRLQLDLGAFAKGYAVDRAIQALRDLGIRNAIINAGGDLRAIGQPGNRPWRIGIRHPREAGILAAIEISGDTSVFTSGDYERFIEIGDRRYHHILDPRNGFPAGHVTSVTVIHSLGATADAAATALFVAGPGRWREIARRMGIGYVMLVDGDGVIHMNPAMADRIQLESPDETIQLSEPL